MKRIEYRGVVDKSKWAVGPWTTEPDKIQWQDEETGLPCLIVRNDYGALCGYVGVKEGHPYYRKHYGDVSVDVHGGLTYSDGCMEGAPEDSGICHIPSEGEPDHVWWLGFDCLHYSDYAPGQLHLFQRGPKNYCTLAYVEGQCRNLAIQLKVLEINQ